LSLTETQIERYSRHILLKEVGGIGQERLLSASAHVLGTGIAAEEAAVYLAAGGVGRLQLSAGVKARLETRIPALNPDITLTEVETDAFEVQPAGNTRFEGALAALRALVLLSGAADSMEWTRDELAWWKT
jgi:molybdopterin/thiamine biosynthesis adenylyltransferase